MRGLETDGSGSRPPTSDGPWLPWMVTLLILGNAFCQVHEVPLRPPQNVTLTFNNSLFLTWQPSPDFTSNTQYEAETRSLHSSPNWTKVTSCQENQASQTQRCDLLPLSLFDVSEARVRARDGVRQSEWASSKPLQTYKDAVITLEVSLTATGDNLTVIISLPPTPRADNNSSELVQRMQKLSYQMTLTEEGVKLEVKSLLFNGSKFEHTYPNLRHNTQYCVKAKAMNQPTEESEKCIRMPGKSADRVIFVMVSVIVIGLILWSIVGGAFFRRHRQRNPSQTTLPKSLEFRNAEPNGNPPVLNPAFCLEEDCIVSVLAEVPPPETNAALQLIPRGYRAQVWSTYCARGFEASSWSSDFHSSGELEYPMGEDYRSAPDLTGSSARPSTSSARLLSHDSGTSCISQNWECNIDNRRPMGSSSLSRADFPFSSMTLQTVVDIEYSPETRPVRKDSDTPQGTPAQQTTESEEHHEPQGFPNSDFQDDSSLELRDMKTMRFSGYESRQPILFCE